MEKLISYLYAITGLAKNAHYRAGGVSFYANHLLADLDVKKFRNYADDLIEVYFLGNDVHNTTPPPDFKSVFFLSAELMPPAGPTALRQVKYSGLYFTYKSRMLPNIEERLLRFYCL